MHQSCERSGESHCRWYHQ